MMMPAGGLEECKKVCDGIMVCYAFEYSVEGDCCVFRRRMCAPKEPTLSNATHHGGNFKDYKGYVKGMIEMIYGKGDISLVLQVRFHHNC